MERKTPGGKFAKDVEERGEGKLDEEFWLKKNNSGRKLEEKKIRQKNKTAAKKIKRKNQRKGKRKKTRKNPSFKNKSED